MMTVGYHLQPGVYTTMHDVLYVLVLQDCCLYVGRCRADRIGARFQEHACGHGAAWTRLHPPARVAYTRPSFDAFDEDACVLRLMTEFGVDAVRGGTWSSVKLREPELQHVRRRIAHALGECLYCGSREHLSNACGNR
jgi:hypothetical protein